MNTTIKIDTKEQFEPLLLQLTRQLKEAYDDFTGIRFFGSRYRGDFTKESDFDIVIIFSEKPGWQKERDVLGMVLNIELQNDIVIDAKIYQETDFNKFNTPFRVNVAREGAYYAA